MVFTKIKNFISFMFSILVLGWNLWKTRSGFEVKEIKDIIVLHFHPDLAPAPALGELKKSFLDPYIKLTGKDPIILALPIGYNISSLNCEEFISVLSHDQYKKFKHAIYRNPKNKIEVVSG